MRERGGIVQILTKRSGRLRVLAPQLDWPANVWMGVSVEDSRVLSRVDDLRKVPAAVRFLSCEPLIGSLADIDLTEIHWVIVGGESGPGCTADEDQMDSRDFWGVPQARRAIFLQAVGRRAKRSHWSNASRPGCTTRCLLVRPRDARERELGSDRDRDSVTICAVDETGRKNLATNAWA